MKILGIVEFHPFDGSPRGLFLLLQGAAGEVRIPITPEQAASLLEQVTPYQEPPSPDPEGGYEEFMDTAGVSFHEDDDEGPLVVPGNDFSMGAAFDDEGDL